MRTSDLRRLEQLEQRAADLTGIPEEPESGRCKVCRNRPAMVLRVTRRVYMPDNHRDDGPGVTNRPSANEDTGEPCPACGWMPKVREICELVIYNREEADAFKRETHAA